MAAVGHFGCRNSLSIAFLAILDQYKFLIFLNFFTKWLPAAILDVQSSLSMAFLVISDQYETFFSKYFYKIAAGAHFGCPKFTFERISGH